MAMKRLGALLLAVTVGGGCDDIVGDDAAAPCFDVLRPSIVAEIRDQGGVATAIGATVTIWNDAGVTGSNEGFGDSLRVSVTASNATGRFSVRVEKPWFGDTLVQNVLVTGGPCGADDPTTVRVSLRLEADAPPVRQVVLPASGIGFLDGNVGLRIPVYVEAAEGGSRELRWSADTAVVALVQDGTITSRCRSTPDSTWVTASSVVDETKRDSVQVWVFAAPTGSTRCP